MDAAGIERAMLIAAKVGIKGHPSCYHVPIEVVRDAINQYPDRFHGLAGIDPTEPHRSTPYPAAPAPLAAISRHIAAAAESLGLKPFPLPLAINHRARAGRSVCQACRTCDGFACAIEAKNDVATMLIRPLIERGLDLLVNTVVTRLECDGQRITSVTALDRHSGRTTSYRADRVFLAAGALASPHLLAASRLARLNPSGHVVGRFLMRHYNEVVLGIFPGEPDRERRFHKQLGIHDFYLGDPTVNGPRGKLGAIQQVPTPPPSLVRANLPRALSGLAGLVNHLTGLLVIAEDQPNYDNRVYLGSGVDRYGLPSLLIDHRYSSRDRAAGRALRTRARQILRRAGAWGTYSHRIATFSHALGTVRMGIDPGMSALDQDCRFRGIENLYVLDGSALPTSGGVNPSLTIAAVALRAATRALSLEVPASERILHAVA
ncbi:MAG: GMC family oxidoreductase, partial [Gemmatimonadota bacterium]